VILKQGADDVFTDIVDIALHCSHHDFTG
jgi:hypothetical protein